MEITPPNLGRRCRCRSGLVPWLLVLFVYCTNVQAEENLVFFTPTVDLGEHKAAGEMEHTFRFQVTGGQPATIVEVRPNCGCLRPRWSPRTYQPGETGEIVLRVHATSQVGARRFELSTTVRDPVERTIILSASAMFVSEIGIEPTNLLLYLDGRHGLRERVLLRDRRPMPHKPLQVLNLTTSDRRLSARLAPESATQGKLAIDLAVAPNYTPGKYEEFIHVETNDPEYARFLIPVTVVWQPIKVLPEVLRGRASTLRDRNLPLTAFIRHHRGEPLRMVEVRCPVTGVECQWPQETTARGRIQVRLAPRLLQQPLDTFLEIHFAAPHDSIVTIPLRVE